MQEMRRKLKSRQEIQRDTTWKVAEIAEMEKNNPTHTCSQQEVDT